MDINELKKQLRYHSAKLVTMVLGDVRTSKLKYRFYFRRKLDLQNPKTLNEKLFCLKLSYNDELHAVVSDKYACRDWLAGRYGKEYLIPLLFHTDKPEEINAENIGSAPCIVKCNNGSGTNYIIRDLSKVDWKKLQKKCRGWLKQNYYYLGQERQYKSIKPRIVVEKLLTDSNGKIPNDYKLTYLNGKLAFVYCSIDREGKNYRRIYSPDWEPLHFTWTAKGYDRSHFVGEDIPAPPTYEKMKEIGSDIATLFKYVRVDFYDVDGVLYYGEVTLCHGNGCDQFYPEKYDLYWGEQLQL